MSWAQADRYVSPFVERRARGLDGTREGAARLG